MDFAQSVLTALFCMAVVIGVLAMLWGVISIFSAVIRKISTKPDKTGSGPV